MPCVCLWSNSKLTPGQALWNYTVGGKKLDRKEYQTLTSDKETAYVLFVEGTYYI